MNQQQFNGNEQQDEEEGEDEEIEQNS